MLKQLKSPGRGLCPSCVYAAECVLREDSSVPTFECDEFCDDESPPWWHKNEKSSVPASARDEPREHPAGGVGLCASCEWRATCVLSNLEGGVWRCEEYR